MISSRSVIITVPFSTTIRLNPPAGVLCSAGERGLSEDSRAFWLIIATGGLYRRRFDETGRVHDVLWTSTNQSVVRHTGCR
jgi:hypothetical protein